MIKDTFTKKFMKVHNAFNNLNKVSIMMIKVGILLSISIILTGLIIYKTSDLSGFSFYNEFLAQTSLKMGAVILLEVFVGAILGDYFLKKGQ